VMWLKNFIHSLVKRSSTMYKTLPQWTNSAHILLLTYESFLLYFIPKIDQVRGNGSTMFYEKCFLFPLLKKVKCFRVRYRFQLLSSKCFRFYKNLTASTASASSFRFHIPDQNWMEYGPIFTVLFSLTLAY